MYLNESITRLAESGQVRKYNNNGGGGICKLSESVPPSGTVNVLATASWNYPCPTWFNPDLLKIVLVQDEPSVSDGTSTIKTTFTRGQTDGKLSFSATKAGTYHLEAQWGNQGDRIGGPIVMTEASPTTTISSAAVSTSSANPRTRTSSSIPVETQSSSETEPSTSESQRSIPYTVTSIVTSTTAIMSTSTPAKVGAQPNVIGPILGSILGILIFTIAAILVYFRYCRNSAHTVRSNMTLVPRPWWSSSRYKFGRKSNSRSDIQSRDVTPETSTISPSDSISQVWAKKKRKEKHRPLRESSDLATIAQRSNQQKG